MSEENKGWTATDEVHSRDASREDSGCEIWDENSRPKSLDFEIFLRKGADNKTDDEKLKEDLVKTKAKAQSLDSVPDKNFHSTK